MKKPKGRCPYCGNRLNLPEPGQTKQRCPQCGNVATWDGNEYRRRNRRRGG